MKSKHWNDIYALKSDKQVSWFQEVPLKSLELIEELNLSHQDHIIDVGGGNSRLVDHLLKKGFFNIDLLDISSVVLESAKNRLGPLAKKVNFIASDITQFQTNSRYKLWHDRAVFHFLNSPEDIECYVSQVTDSVEAGGFFIISSFSLRGPDKCSGLPVTKYSIESLNTLFSKAFKLVKGFEDNHQTPWGSDQNFVYCLFQKT